MKNRKSTILLSLLCLFASLFGLFQFTNLYPDQKGRDKPYSTGYKNETENLNMLYKEQLDSIVSIANSLQAKETAIRVQLCTAKENNRCLQQQVNTLLSRSKTVIDTPTKLVVCDSLQEAVEVWITASASKDSIYEQEVNALNEIIGNKDSTIYVCQQMYTTIRHSFDNCFADNEMLLEEKNSYARKSKGLKIKNKILSAGIMLVSGIAIYNFINH